jgi:uncharacterized protein (TIGR02996 family)
MTDGEALLRAILGQPKEDTPRLAYADWCDENGQPERAEFIRAAIEHAKTHPDPRNIDHWYTRSSDTLWGDLKLEWRTRVGRFPSVWGWYRGFVCYVERDWDYWCAHADRIRAIHPVERVRLTTDPFFSQPGMDYAGRRYGYHVAGKIIWVDERHIMLAGGVRKAACEVLSHRWPGIEFELPPERGESLRDWWDNHTQEHAQ